MKAWWLVAAALLLLLPLWTRFHENGMRLFALQPETPPDASRRVAPLKVSIPASSGRPAGQASNWKPLPPLDVPLMQVMGELKARVGEGDHRAACRIGFELARCARLPHLRQSVFFWRKHIQDPKTTDEQRKQTERMLAAADHELAESEVVCPGVTDSDLPNAWDYLLASALAGNAYAAWRISLSPPGLNMFQREETLEGWAQWRQYMPALMEQGIRRGDPRIISLASRDSRLPREGMRVLPSDNVRSLGYEIALLSGVSEAYRPKIESDIQSLLRDYQLSDAQVAEARRFAATIQLKVTPGGFDWSRGMEPDPSARSCEEP